MFIFIKQLLPFVFICCSTLLAQNIQNPVLPGVADAGVMKYNGKYYIGGVYTNGDFYVSNDLVHWSKPIHVVSMDNDWTKGTGAGDNQIHANDMFYLNGKFHMYWSVNYWGKDKHAVHIVHAQSDNVLGTYLEPDRKTWMDNRIDPKVFKDDDGQLYMYMVRFTDGNTIWVRKMKNPAEFSGEPICLFASLPNTWETMDNRVAEGPWVMKYRDRYYMMYNANHTSTAWGNYRLGVSESDSPLGFQHGNKYSYPVVQPNQTPLEETYVDLLRYTSTYDPNFSYVEHTPQGQWTEVGYDDSFWSKGAAGFGSNKLEGSTTLHCRTQWNTSGLWLRKIFHLPVNVGNLALRIAHGGDTKVYMNGHLIYDKQGTDYCIINLDKKECSALCVGDNVISIETHQGNSNFFDVSLFDMQRGFADDIIMTPGQPNILRGPNGFEWWLIYMANLNLGRRGQFIDRVHFFNKTMYVDGMTGSHTYGYHPEPSKPTYGDTFDGNASIHLHWKWDDDDNWIIRNGELAKIGSKASLGILKGFQPATDYLFEVSVSTEDEAGIIVWSQEKDYIRLGLDATSNSWYLYSSISGYENTKTYPLPKDFKWGVYHSMRVEKNRNALRIALDDLPLDSIGGLSQSLSSGLPGVFAGKGKALFDGITYTVGFDDYDSKILSWDVKEGNGKNTPDGLKVSSNRFTAFKGDSTEKYECDFQISSLSDSTIAGGYPLFVDEANYVKAAFNGMTRKIEVKVIRGGNQILVKNMALDTLYTLYSDVKYTDNIEKGYRLAAPAWIDALYLSRHEVDNEDEFVENMFDKFIIEYLYQGEWHEIKSERVTLAEHPKYNKLSFAPIKMEGLRFINKKPEDLRRHIYKIRIHELFRESYNLRAVRKGDNLFLFVDGKNVCLQKVNFPVSRIGLFSEKGAPIYNGILFYHIGE